MTIDRTVPNIRSDRPGATRDFFVELLGFGWQKYTQLNADYYANR